MLIERQRTLELLESAHGREGQRLWKNSYFRERWSDDREVVLCAVKHKLWHFPWTAFFSASDRLKDDKGVVLEAVKWEGQNALGSASLRCRDDPEIVRVAVEPKL